ncbi:MAG: HK97 family phage prohead protease [Eubacterium sp.]
MKNKGSEKETRQCEQSHLEVRKKKSEETNAMTIGGYAVKYGEPAIIRDIYGDAWLEEFSEGAFDESLKDCETHEKEKKALWNHDRGKPLGSTVSRTLRFIPSSEGLSYDVDLPDNSWGKDVYESVKRGDVTGSSFGFIKNTDKWTMVEFEGKKMSKRTIMEAKLTEVSPCTFPAYESSEISCRSREDYKKHVGHNSDEKNENELEIEQLRTKILLNS